MQRQSCPNECRDTTNCSIQLSSRLRINLDGVPLYDHKTVILVCLNTGKLRGPPWIGFLDSASAVTVATAKLVSETKETSKDLAEIYRIDLKNNQCHHQESNMCHLECFKHLTQSLMMMSLIVLYHYEVRLFPKLIIQLTMVNMLEGDKSHYAIASR